MKAHTTRKSGKSAGKQAKTARKPEAVVAASEIQIRALGDAPEAPQTQIVPIQYLPRSPQGAGITETNPVPIARKVSEPMLDDDDDWALDHRPDQTNQELLAELDEVMAAPYDQPSLFVLMDKVERCTRQGDQQGVSFNTLVAQSLDPSRVDRRRLGELIARAIRGGLLVPVGAPVKIATKTTVAMTDYGRRFLRGGRQTRVALRKLNGGLSMQQVCAIVEEEEIDSACEYTMTIGHDQHDKDKMAERAESREMPLRVPVLMSVWGGLCA